MIRDDRSFCLGGTLRAVVANRRRRGVDLTFGMERRRN
jgi:hypothetical protein